ncbi:MAG: hypothetical protein ABI330_15140 [Caldimonas sp.]
MENSRIFFGRLLAGAGVSLAALGRGHVDAAHEQAQVCRGEFEAGLPCFAIDAGRGIEFLKSAGLEPLVPDDQTVSLPEEDLDAIAAAIEKQEQVAREGILAEKFLHHSEKTVEAFAHVGRFCAEEDADCGGELRKHQLAPLREPSSCPAAVIAAWSNEGSMVPLSRSTQELVNSISSSVHPEGPMIDSGRKLGVAVE